MEMRADVLLAILGMALVSYACRAGGYAILRSFRPPEFIECSWRRATWGSRSAPAWRRCGGRRRWPGRACARLTPGGRRPHMWAMFRVRCLPRITSPAFA